MQIHELNTFGGTLGANDFFATDNSIDTSKVSAADMFAPLNTRIDNIIAGPASSAEEVIDARLGADGKAYDSLGDAIRDQLSDVNVDASQIANAILNITGDVLPLSLELGSINTNTGRDTERTDGAYLRTGFLPVTANGKYSLFSNNGNSARVAIHAIFYNSSKTFLNTVFLGYVSANAYTTYNFTAPNNAGYVRFRLGGTNMTVAQETLKLTYYDAGGVPAYKGVINTVGLDLNNFVTPGVWQLNDFGNYRPNNYPVAANGKIIVLSNNNPLTSATTFQFIFTYQNGAYYRSSGTNETWNNWTRLADVSDTLYNFGNVLTTGLDLNGGDFIHPGMWTINDPASYPVKNCPTDKRCRIISFTSHTNNTIYTYQIVVDADNTFERFSTSSGAWTQWTHRNALHKGNSFDCVFTASTAFVNNYDISRDTGETGRVSRMYALYDAVTDPDVTITKETLGRDASNTFDIYNYKVSLNTGNKPVVLLIVGEHGDELNSAMVGYYAYREIVTGVLKKYLNFVDFWVVPLMNPYGYEHQTRNNANDVNLNRDFPAEWAFSTSAHNKTGEYSLSQPETVIIYDLLVNNRDKFLFICNKHDTGSIATKIDTAQEDKVAYVSSYIKTDSVTNRGVSLYENNQVRTTDSWIITDCDVDLSATNLIVTRNVKTPGSLDLFANSIGIHGSLLEVCGSAYYSTDTNHHYSSQHRNDLNRLGLDFFVNYLSQTIEHNSAILDNDDLIDLVRYYTRTLVEGSYVDTEQYWNGSELVNI